MRILFAKLLVAVTGLLIVILAVLFAVIQNPANDDQPGALEQFTVTTSGADRVAPTTQDPNIQASAQAATITRGRAVYAEQRCRVCHSIGGEGNTRFPLDGVSGRLSEKQIRLWIVAPQEMDPAVAKRGYALSEEDLNALMAYLAASSNR